MSYGQTDTAAAQKFLDRLKRSNWWKPKVGENRVRLLPPPTGETQWWFEWTLHWGCGLPGDGLPGKDGQDGHVGGPLVFLVEDHRQVECRRRVQAVRIERLLDPYTVKFYLSGGKGFHAIVPAKIFDAQDGDPYLPLIYKKITVQLFGFILCNRYE